MLVFSATYGVFATTWQWSHGHYWFLVFDVLGAAIAWTLIWYRRRWPLPVALAIQLCSIWSGLATGPSILVTVSVATRRKWREIVPVAAAGIIAGEVAMVLVPAPGTSPPWWVQTLTGVISGALLISWGLYIGSRRELIWTLRQRAERAEAEQDLRAAQARGTERARIAREMHDVLAHRISQISMQAGALSFRDDLTTEQLRSGAGEIRDQAHQALTELRGVLGVLRDLTTGEVTDRPQPTYDDLADLFEGARASGMRIIVEDGLEGSPPATTGRTLYRIAQEGVTNAGKHAPGAALHVAIDGDSEEGITFRLANPIGFPATSPPPGAGLGLVGLTERADLSGGRLEYRREGSDFVLSGWIPWVT